MKKKFFTRNKLLLFVLLMLIFSVFSVVLAENAENELRLTINGIKVDTAEKYGTPVILDDDDFFVPLNAVADVYETELEWNNETARIVVGETEAVFTVGSDTALKNGEETAVSRPVYVSNGTPMVSGTTLSETLGLMTSYNAEKGLVTIIKRDAKREAEIAATDSEEKGESKQKGSKLDEIVTVISAMNEGFLATLKLFAITLIGALPLGLVISLCSMSRFSPLKYLTRLLVWIIRGTPLMLQLLIIFYIPGKMFGGVSPWPRGEEGRFMAASVAFIINYAFYFSEIFRGGIENVPKGQVEAGQVLGMTKTQIFFNVTLMQMIKRIVPPMSNEIITLVKDTSIARIISMQEVIWAGYAFLKRSHGYSGLLWPLFFTGVYYLIFNGLLTVLFGKIEKKLSYFN